MTRRTRILRYGGSIAVALVGVACGALIPGTAGGTAATVLVGIGLVGVVSLIFYEIGLTEDRDRARDTGAWSSQGEVRTGGEARPEPRPQERPRHTHQEGRSRIADRRRGQRRRLR